MAGEHPIPDEQEIVLSKLEDYDLVEAHDAMNAAGLADRGPDQVSFDPAYRTHPLEHYEPLVREMFARPSRTFL